MKSSFLKLFLACCLIGIANYSYTDDSEIFFSKDLANTKPNIIFLLDTSGSMAWKLKSDANISFPDNSRIETLKNSLEEILMDPSIYNLRIGIMTFESTTKQLQQILDIDEIDASKDIDKTSAGVDKKNLNQRILNSTDDGIQLNDRSRPMFEDTWEALENDRTMAFRFNNILLKDPDSVGITSTDKGITNATFALYSSYTNQNTIKVYIDTAVNAPYLKAQWNNFSDRLSGIPLICESPSGNSYFNCDVTKLIRDKISQNGWQNGNAITFYIRSGTDNTRIYFSDTSAVNQRPSLKIEANSSLIAENEMTFRDQVMGKVLGLNASGGTEVVNGMYEVARYISNIPAKSNPGPYHDNKWGPSPLLEGCQSTHMVVMSDGSASGGWSGTVGPYIGQSANSCQIFTDENGTKVPEGSTITAERCGRALVSWMARRSQSNLAGENFVRTHSIGFAVSSNSAAQKFLNDIAKFGMGKSYNAQDASQLTQAFKDIITGALVVNTPTASGRVTLSPQSQYKQRTEVFYAIYKSESYNYWSGNMKGFQLKYVDDILTDGSTGKRAILYDKNGSPAMGADGVIKNTAYSFWSKTGATADGGKVDAGGVVAMLPDDPSTRSLFSIKNGSVEKLNSSNSNLTTADLNITGDNAENVKKGLLDFILGYTYVIGGSTEVAPKKIGDSARSSVALAAYGCNNNGEMKTVLDCSFSELSQVALLASNDGFIRGYNVTSGTALYEFMPQEMLPLIKGLQAKASISMNRTRFYGLDGSIALYHDDKNEDGYINNGEAAYAYAVAGRGGSNLYALNISNKTSPKLAWQIDNQTNGFDKLGAAWSVPVVGKIKIDNIVTPVLVFGGGYDISQDNSTVRKADNVGNALYIVNAKTGAIIWSTSANMQYSIPSSVAVATDESTDKLITDIFVGDMGGQLWRFAINNGSTGNELVKPAGGDNGIIAEFAGDTEETSRRFYHAPVVYKFKDKNVNFAEKLAVSIASGYRAHPLSTQIQDRIYSLRLPRKADASSLIPITEADLAVTAADGQSLEKAANLENGFMIKLGISGNAAGEKVVSEGFSDFDRIVFNAYIPTKTVTVNCVPGSGTQRTYNYSVLTGESLLETSYIETSVSALPPDATAYCDGSYCTIVSDPGQLSKENPLHKGKNGNDPFVVKTGSGAYVKTGWTDIFDLATN